MERFSLGLYEILNRGFKKKLYVTDQQFFVFKYAESVSLLFFIFLQELSQEKQRTLQLLGEKEAEEESSEKSCMESEDGDLLQDLHHIEEQMKILLKEKEQAEDKWV